jgi:hypothetical protein
MRPPPNRGRALRAIKLTRDERGEAIVPDGPNGIAVDMLLAIVVWTDYRRDREKAKIAAERTSRRENPENWSSIPVIHKKGLHSIVKESVAFYRFDPAREYIYLVVVLRYYSLLSVLVRRARRMSETPTKKKSALKKAA